MALRGPCLRIFHPYYAAWWAMLRSPPDPLGALSRFLLSRDPRAHSGSSALLRFLEQIEHCVSRPTAPSPQAGVQSWTRSPWARIRGV
eukprot:5588851-Pyramimonas_sp.AAC.1